MTAAFKALLVVLCAPSAHAINVHSEQLAQATAQWSLYAYMQICTTNYKRLAGTSTWQECAALADLDADCGIYTQFSSEVSRGYSCFCVLSGEPCPTAESTIGYSVYVKQLDTTPPVITLNGAAEIVISVGSPYVDYGVTVTGAEGGTVVSDDILVNPNLVGTYIVTYRATDAAGNFAEVLRSVVVEAPDVSGTGDPHLRNLRGEQFDLYRPGIVSLLHVPRQAEPARTLLRVTADARRMGGVCSIYFQVVTITGMWTNESQPIQFVANQHGAPEGRSWKEWMRFGSIELKVAHQTKGVDYLNVYARNVSRSGYEVGGLLGLDDHADVATRPRECAHRHAATLWSSSAEAL